jgi:hypothetical protein
MSEVKFKPGGLLGGQVFTLDDNFLKYKNAYGKYATVPRKSIETVVIEPKKRGASYLKLIGKGTDLASIEMPHTWCEKTQLWLMEQLGI